MSYKFPYTNYHELNLTWVLDKLKELFTASEENVTVIETYNGRLTAVETELPTVSATAENAAQVAAAASTVAQTAKATADTAQENAIQAQSLAGYARREAQAAQTAADEATQAAQQAQAVSQNFDARITQAQNDADTAKGNALTALNKIGDLSALETTAKQNLVAAINDVFENRGPVDSVNGKTGVVVLNAEDIGYNNTNVESELDALNNKSNSFAVSNVLDSITLVNGSISGSTGGNSPTSASKRLRSNDYFYIPFGFSIVIPTGFRAYFYYYTDKRYQTFIRADGWYTGTYTNTSPYGIYVRISIAREDDTDLSPSDVGNVSITTYSNTDNTLTQVGKAADSKTVGTWITRESKIIIPWEQGEYRTDNGAGRSSSTKIRSLHHVPFRQYISITIPDGYMIKWFQYSGLSYTSFVKSSEWLTGTVKIYEDGNWYKFVLSKTDESALTPSDVSNIDLNVIVGDAYNTVFEEYGGYTAIIMVAIMSCYGSVYLKQGTYNIDRTIVMKDNQSIIGDGFNTILRFADGLTGACIKASNRNMIKNVQIKGRDVDYVLEDPQEDQEVVPSTMGTRHGIEITGDIRRGIVQNCYIHGFDGFAIYAHDNSISSHQGWSITDSYFTNNYGGIYLQESEFYRITGCDCNINYIGMFNGGGNNMITACNFSSNYYGINMNNSDGASYNNSHGSITGCSIQHSRINAILIDNMASGEVITGCNIDEGGVKIKDAYRIVFSACNFMGNFTIEITNGGLVMFIGCNMRNYTLDHTTITNNTAVKFINCYEANGDLMNLP